MRSSITERDQPSVRLGVWNTEWATLRSARGRLAKAVLTELSADVLVVTEGVSALLPDGGHVVTSEADYGYVAPAERRKVLLWSREPWSSVDTIGDGEMSPGRFVCGVTETPAGPIRVVGVCIPWRDAHVNTGERNRARWEDHLTYIGGLRRLLVSDPAEPTVVAGDFNQRIPRKRQPKRIFEPLEAAFAEGFCVATAGVLEGVDAPLIDHVVHDRGLEAREVRAWSRFHESGTRMSDHHGALVSLVRQRRLTMAT